MAERRTGGSPGTRGKAGGNISSGTTSRNKIPGNTSVRKSSKNVSRGKARKNTAQKKNLDNAGKRSGIGMLVLCLILITAAVFGGYALANSIRSGSFGTGSGKNPGKSTDKSNGPNSSGTPDITNDPDLSQTPVLLKTPAEVIYDFDPDTERIDAILIGILNTTENRLDYINIDTDVMYTMSAGLYSALTPDNTTLPQTVTFSELYRYYCNDKAFDAGRRMIGEMLNLSIPYYSAMPEYDFERLFLSDKYDGESEYSFAVNPAKAKSDYSTLGSVKGFVECIFENTVTNWGTEDRLRYLDTLDELENGDVTFTDAPVIEKNESCLLDTDAVGRILYDILY